MIARKPGWIRGTLFIGAIALLSGGCNPISTAYFLFRGDGKAPADYPLTCLDKERKEIRVAFLATSGSGLSWEFAGVERELANAMGKKLAEGTKEEKHPVKMIRPDDIEKFKASHPTWKVMNPSQIARQLGADYVVDITLTGIGLFDPQSGKNIYQGWATADVSVYTAGEEQPKYQYYHKSTQYPQPADAMPVGQYKSFLITQLAYELATRHMKHTNDKRIAPIQP